MSTWLSAYGYRYADLLRSLTWAAFRSPKIILPILAAFLGEFAFRMVDWLWVQTAMRDLVVGSVTLLGQEADNLGLFRYSIGNETFVVTPRCTYVDFLCFTTPLVLRSWSLVENVRRISLFWGGILLLCVARIVFAHLLNGVGVPWIFAHDSIDYGLRSVAMLVVIYWWLEASLQIPTKTAGCGQKFK